MKRGVNVVIVFTFKITKLCSYIDDVLGQMSVNHNSNPQGKCLIVLKLGYYFLSCLVLYLGGIFIVKKVSQI